MKSKFSLTLGQLNRALNNPALIDNQLEYWYSSVGKKEQELPQSTVSHYSRLTNHQQLADIAPRLYNHHILNFDQVILQPTIALLYFLILNVVKCNLTQLTRSKRYTCGHSCITLHLALCCGLALCFVLALHCFLQLHCIVSVVVGLYCFLRHLHPYYFPVCSVCIQWLQLLWLVLQHQVSGLPITCAARLQLTVWLEQR